MSQLSSPLYICPRLRPAVVAAANTTVAAVAVWLLVLPGTSVAAKPVAPPRPAAAVSEVLAAPVAAKARPVSVPVRVALRHLSPAQPAARRSPSPKRPATSAHRAITLRLPAVRKPTTASWSDELAAAIGRIPGYQQGDAQWVTSSAFGSWGTADWYHGVVYISPRVPRTRLYDVAVHEWSHLLSVRPYSYNVDEAVSAMNGYFGGTGLVGAERAADCMALLLGARWTHYTSCSDAVWRAGAARLVKGQRL
jgi:hypothetical protein